MKRISILTVLLLATLSLFAERVTPETARKVATTFLNNNGAKTAQLTDLTKVAGFQNLYIFTAEQGFVVMAADDRVKPILGYSLTGKFVAEGMPENVRGWLQGYSDQIQDVINLNLDGDKSAQQEWQDLKEGKAFKDDPVVVVGPLLTTQWDQDSPYNNLCPSGTVTGCVATAMAQVMKYWNYPSSGIGSHSYDHATYGTQSANFGTTTYDWVNMTNTYGGSSTAAEQLAVATLMYHCGVSVEMNYGTSSSGAVTAYVADALKTYFGYSSDVHHKSRSDYDDDDEWIALLKADLDLHRPIQYHGNNNGSGGHSFVFDGYRTDNYFHINWGWSGNCDAYYLINSLNPGPGGIGSGSHGIYNDNQGAILGIHPSPNNHIPTNLTRSILGLRTVTLNWDATAGISSYNIYRNNLLIGNTTSTTFTETAPFGTNNYYVRSVDASSELSLPSNIVTAIIHYQMPIVNDLQVTLSSGNGNLSWTAPDWCYPETPTATLTYGDGNLYSLTTTKYWAHRYPSSTIVSHANKALYKVSFYAYESGTYNCYIYKGSTVSEINGAYQPNVLLTSKTVNVPTTNSWVDIDLDIITLIDDQVDIQNDIWVVMNDPDNGNNGRYAAALCNYSDANNQGNYWQVYTSGSTIGYGQNSNIAWLIKAYLTDGTYTYHLYDNGVSVADDIATTSYTVTTSTTNTAHQYTVKTNYYNGETAASNMAGLTLGTAELTNLNLSANDKMTVTENAKLTVTGTLTNTTAANLVIENGAQLYTESAGVKATVKKDITGYGNDNSVKHGWNLIALPITENYAPAAPMTSNTYDLYRLNPATTKWENYKPGNAASGFDLVNGRGYLYANSNDVTLEFAGTVKPYSIGSNTVPLVAGWNLVGNPYTFNVYSNKSFYKIGTDGEGHNVITVSTADDAIAPCRGIVVKSTNTDPIAFTAAPVSWATGDQRNLNFVLTQQKVTRDGVNETIVDNAIVSFNEGAELEKFYFGESNANLYIPQGQEEYAIVYSDKQSELPINFKAYENGEYTLTVTSPLTSQFSVLNLIDNLTGTTIDLLQTPSYTFEAKTSDYAARFRLIFNENENQNENDDFAFINNGEIIVNGTGTLQIFDALGREIIKKDLSTLNSKLSTLNFKPGVYILRTVNGNEVKTKKIIIK